MCLGSRIGAAGSFRRRICNASHEVDDAAAEPLVDPDAAFHAVGISGVTDQYRTSSSHVIGTACHMIRDLVRAVPGAAVESAIGLAIASAEAPDLRKQDIDRRG